jgi:site-specific recombinase XerD
MSIRLSELIERTNDCIRSLEHSPSTVYQYQMTWKALADYFREHDQALFSRQLAEQYLLESKARLEAGVIKRWRYKLDRRTVHMLIECFEYGHVSWKYYEDPPAYLHRLAYLCLHADYLNHLREEGKGAGTVQTYGIVSRQFLEYLEQREIQDIAEVGVNEISSFIPFISKQYQPASMRTVLSALRCFLRYVEDRHLTPIRLSNALPASGGRTIRVVPTLTPEEEQHLLDSADRTTASGRRNYAMLLLALRIGLRSIDILNLKLEDIHWQSNTIEIVQAKTGTPLVLPLLTEVGNAIADYLLNGRPTSPQPYIFLRSQAPYRKLAGHANCYGISRTLMDQAGIRQGKGERKGFHCLRHSVAARLLAAGTPLPLISSILGHQNKNSTKLYLSTDLEHLRASALSLMGIEVTREVLL